MFVGGDLVTHPGGDALYDFGSGPGHLAHHIHIVHAAVHQRGHIVDKGFMQRPFGTVALLVKVHAHDERFAQRPGQLDELDPGRMLAQDIADDQLTPGLSGHPGYICGFFHGAGDGFLHKYMTSLLHGKNRKLGVGIGVGIDGNHIGLLFFHRLVIVGVYRNRQLEVPGQLLSSFDIAGHYKTNDFVTIEPGVAQSMGGAHTSDTDY